MAGLFAARKWRKTRLFFSIGLVLTLLALTFAYGMFQGGFVSWFLFYSFLPFALYALLLLCYPLKATVERSIPARAFTAGDQIEVRLTITRDLAFPLLFLLIEDGLSLSTGQEAHKQIFFPGFKRKVNMVYTLKSIPRGEHSWNAIRLKTGDLLGLADKETWISDEQKILVYPSYHPIHFQPKQGNIERGGSHSTSKWQRDASLLAGIRKYEPGDRFSWIDWKASAKSNEMMVKEFEAQQSSDALIMLDLFPAKDFELMVQFAASTVQALLKSGGEAGLFLGRDERIVIRPRRGAGQERNLFYYLAKVKPDSSSALNVYLQELAIDGPPSLLIIITSKLTKEMIDCTEKMARQKGRVMIFLVKGRGEKILPEEAALTASAEQKGISVQTLYEHNFPPVSAGVKKA